jgi:hypothetical protein
MTIPQTEQDRRALGARRRLVFQNIANGVHRGQIRESLRLSDLEIDQARDFVLKKITEHLLLRRQPALPAQTEPDIRWYRIDLLAVLSRIGDLDLGTSLILTKMLVQPMDHPEMIEGASRRMQEAY